MCIKIVQGVSKNRVRVSDAHTYKTTRLLVDNSCITKSLYINLFLVYTHVRGANSSNRY